MTACALPTCLEPRGITLGATHDLAAVLCVEHALLALRVPAAAKAPARRVAPERPDLRRRCWGDRLTCPRPPVTLTPHARLCAVHAPPDPEIPTEGRSSGSSDHLPDPALLAAAALVMRGLGATPIRTERTFGDVEGLEGVVVIPARHYARPPSRAVAVEPDDERVPKGARANAKAALGAGWSVRLTVVDEPPSAALRAWRGSLLIAARWEAGKFVIGWGMLGRNLPTKLGARQVGALLKASPHA